MSASVDIGHLLALELGADRVITRGDERLDDYGKDESPLGPFPADAAALCQSAAEVAVVLRLCAEHRVPVTPRGAGSGLTGGCLPIRGGVVLSVEKMAAIKEISVDDLVCVVEPGVITGQLQAAVEELGRSTRRIRPASSTARSAATRPTTPAGRAPSSTASPASTCSASRSR
jgi:FAD/FMN-containing dehydrogenase